MIVIFNLLRRKIVRYLLQGVCQHPLIFMNVFPTENVP